MYLKKPLEEAEKVPVSQREFTAQLNRHSHATSDLLDREGLRSIWRVSDNEQAPDLAMRTILFVIENTPPSGETEAAFHKFWDNLIDDTLHIAQPGKTFRDTDRNMSTGMARPDYGFCMRGHCLFRGEEKAPGSKQNPKDELITKLEWSYDPLPFILGGLYTFSLTITDNPISRLCCYWRSGRSRYDNQ